MHFLETLRNLAHVLNYYANLLLAALTATYVLLTWRTLKALQRASLREAELRHLDEIKSNVARPLIEWLDSSAVRILRGSYPPIFVTNVMVPRPNAAVGERTYDIRRQLDCQLLDPLAYRGGLFSHSRLNHFPNGLSQFEAFLAKERQFMSDLLVFARSCADEIARMTKLPRRSASENVPDAADTETLVEICIRDLFLGKAMPEIEFTTPTLGVLHVGDGYVARPIGKGATEPTKAWVENGIGRFRDRWKQSGLRERIDGLLQEAAALHAALEDIEFIQALPHECEYIGGKGPNFFKRMWHRRQSHI